MSRPGDAAARGRGRTVARRAFLVAVPAATAFVVAGHPPDPATAADLGERTGRYIAIHVALLFLLPLLGIALWLLLEGLSGLAATVSRLAIPVMLVFYAAFDALVGIAAGVLSREAVATAGAERAGAEALAARWMEIPMPLPIVSGVATVAWTVALLAAALAHYRAGSSWIAVGGLALAGPLFGFGHPFFTGVVGMAAFIAAALAIELRPRARAPAAERAGGVRPAAPRTRPQTPPTATRDRGTVER